MYKIQQSVSMMRKTKISLTIICLFLCALFGGCAFLPQIIPTIPTGNSASSGNYSVTVTQVTGNAATQNLTVVLMITNRGANSREFVGGSISGTMAVDVAGNTLQPHSSTGVNMEFPTGVPVKVTIERFGAIPPGTSMLRILRVSIGSRNEIVEFRNVPIVW